MMSYLTFTKIDQRPYITAVHYKIVKLGLRVRRLIPERFRTVTPSKHFFSHPTIIQAFFNVCLRQSPGERLDYIWWQHNGRRISTYTHIHTQTTRDHCGSDDVCISIFSTDKFGFMSVTRRIASASAYINRTISSQFMHWPTDAGHCDHFIYNWHHISQSHDITMISYLAITHYNCSCNK